MRESPNNVRLKTPAEARRMYIEWATARDNLRMSNDEKIIDYFPTFEENDKVQVQDKKGISKDLKRALNLDKKYQDYNWYVDDVIEKLVNSFDLSMEVKNVIKYYIKTGEPNNNFDVITIFLKYVDNRNPPITSSEIWKSVKTLKVKQEGGVNYFKDSIFKERDYDWLITKTLSKFPSETFKIFPKIKKKYHVYKKTYPESIAEKLIKSLCYVELKKMNIKCTLKMIGLTGVTSKKYKNRFKELGIWQR